MSPLSPNAIVAALLVPERILIPASPLPSATISSAPAKTLAPLSAVLIWIPDPRSAAFKDVPEKTSTWSANLAFVIDPSSGVEDVGIVKVASGIVIVLFDGTVLGTTIST